jgi:AcrR family transcriptional regulator
MRSAVAAVPVPVPKPTKGDAKRAAYLEAARALVHEGGLAALTTTALAERTGSSLGALYRHFPGKAAVVQALQTVALTSLRARFVGSDEAPLRQLVRGLHAFVMDDSADARLLDAIAATPAVLYSDDEAHAAEAALQAVLEAVVELLQAASGAKPPRCRRAVLALWAGLQGVRVLKKRDRLLPASEQAAAVALTLVSAQLAAVGLEPLAVERAWRQAERAAC